MSPDDPSATEDLTTITVPPHPRLLSVLGDIEFQPWQCLAELVDNAFDDFLRQAGSTGDGEQPTVWVTLPSRNSTPRNGEVWVKDNGSGMTLAQLTDALRAGWTSNDRYGHLGLFGVGFNIATARLGQVSVVRTARVQDPVWQVVTIDLRNVARGDDFRLPVTTELKTTPGEHGTEVVIRELKSEHHETLSRQQARIRGILGDVYAPLLVEHDFHLIVDREAVKPRRACVWGADRFVVRNREQIPAVIKIDESLPDRIACLNCGAWQDFADEAQRTVCQSTNLRVEQRRIRGWVGIQRYLHTKDFGIDFIRNGRKILVRDVSIFSWVDPDDPGSRGEPEYPVELPAGAGRIVGEIHIDHVRVNYQKTAFEYDTPDWQRVVRVLRGEGPLKVQRAKNLGYPTNNSPLARLFTGYRRNVPGLDYLIPGNGDIATHELAKAWSDRFRKGEAKYQSDEEWYRAAYLHSNPPVPADPEPSPPDDLLGNKGLLPPPAGPTLGPPPKRLTPAAVETEDDRRAKWRAAGFPLLDLEATFGLRGQGAALKISAWLVRGEPVFRDGTRVPVYVGPGRGSEAEVFVDGDHPVFTEFAVDTRDLVIMEIADYLRQRNRLTDRPLSAMVADLKAECLPDHRVAGPFIVQNATRLLSRVRELMMPVIAGNAAGYWSLVTPEDQAATQGRFALEGATNAWDSVVETGEWIDYAPGSALVRVVAARPDGFMDNRVFKAAHQGLTDPDARKASAERIVDLLSDVAVLADRPVRRGPEELQRGRLSCRIIEQELAHPAGDA